MALSGPPLPLYSGGEGSKTSDTLTGNVNENFPLPEMTPCCVADSL